MQRLSTNYTLFLKFFIPIFWLVFFGLFLLAMFTFGKDLTGFFRQPLFQIGAILFYVSGLALFYFTLLSIKRVEADEDFVYATNYFKTYRYPWHNVASMEESAFLFFHTVTIKLKKAGQFGDSLRFIASKRLYDGFWEEHPDIIAVRKKV
jgi:hypothetical protein